MKRSQAAKSIQSPSCPLAHPVNKMGIGPSHLYEKMNPDPAAAASSLHALRDPTHPDLVKQEGGKAYLEKPHCF